MSNPESLYVWGDVDGNTYFSWNEDGKPLMVGVQSDRLDSFFKALSDWETIDNEWIDFDYPFTHLGITVVECQVPTNEKSAFSGEQKNDHKIKLSFGDETNDLFLYSVTWDYLKSSFYEDILGQQTFGLPWYRKLHINITRFIRRRKARRTES
jgi:hypothetical protein